MSEWTVPTSKPPPMRCRRLSRKVEEPHGERGQKDLRSAERPEPSKTRTGKTIHPSSRSPRKKDPEIAIAAYVENAGYGGSWAAPISRLMIEKHIRDTITDKQKEKRILEKKILDRGKVEADG